jgi:hypothetical protein
MARESGCGQVMDIVFVHGLNGSPVGTWTHPQTKWFWPRELTSEEGFENVRVSTFGYNSRSLLGAHCVLDLKDFAMQLLSQLDGHLRVNGQVRYPL